MGREWSERHIIELIDRHGGGGDGSGIFASSSRLLFPSRVPTIVGGQARTFRMGSVSGVSSGDGGMNLGFPVLSLGGIRNTFIIQPGTSFAAEIRPVGGGAFRGNGADPRVHVFIPHDPRASYGGRHVMYHRMIPGIGTAPFNRQQTVDFGDGETYNLSGALVNYGGPEFTQVISHAVSNMTSNANWHNVYVGVSTASIGDDSFWPWVNRLNDFHNWGTYLTLGEPLETFTMFALMAQFTHEKQKNNDTTISTIDTREYGFTY